MLLVWLFPYSSLGISLLTFKIGHITIPVLNLIVLAIFVIASITDFLDGNIARKNNMVTTFGKFADPIADKLLVNTTLIVMASKGMIPVLPVVLMLCRDTIVDGCRMLASSKGVVVAAGFLGKLKTVLQMITIVLVLINNLPFELVSFPMSDLMIWFTAFVSVAAGYSYFMDLREYIFESI